MDYKHHIFLSYSRKDTDIMGRIRDDLRAAGLTIWTDEGIELGTSSWMKAIEEAIEGSGCLLVMLSPDAKASQWVEKEIMYAQTHGTHIFPILIKGDESTSVPFALIGYQYIHFSERAEYQAQLQKLCIAINSHLKLEPLPLLTHSNIADVKKRILVIEDSTEYQEQIKNLSAELGAEVDISANRYDASQLIKKSKYNLITLDMQLSIRDTGGEGGIFLLNMWKQYQPNTPLIIISALPWDKNKTRDFLVEYKVLDILDKPFDENLLLHYLKTSLGSSNE